MSMPPLFVILFESEVATVILDEDMTISVVDSGWFYDAWIAFHVTGKGPAETAGPFFRRGLMQAMR